jgi:hypothetical protein
MRIALLPAQFLELSAHETSVPNDSHLVLGEPLGEVVLPPVVNAMRLQRSEFFRGMHGDHDHLGVLPKRGRIFRQREKPLHDDDGIRIRFPLDQQDYP